MKSYGYFINLDERGEFYADVRDPDTGETVFEITTPGATELVEDGFVKDVRDPGEIELHLIDLGIIEPDDEVIAEN